MLKTQYIHDTQVDASICGYCAEELSSITQLTAIYREDFSPECWRFSQRESVTNICAICDLPCARYCD